MICYTNHALDQFLENCMQECGLATGVIRIGSRSKSVSLEPFLLKNIRAKMRRHRKKKDANNVASQIRQQRAFSTQLGKRIYELNDLVRFARSYGLLAVKLIEKYIPKTQLHQFNSNQGVKTRKGRTVSDYNLLQWLGFFDIKLEEKKLKYENNVITNICVVNDEDMDDNLSLNEARMLDEDFDTKCADVRNTIKTGFERKRTSGAFLAYGMDVENIFQMYIDFNCIRDQLDEQDDLLVDQEYKKLINQHLVKILNTEHRNERFKMYKSWLSQFLNEKTKQIENLNHKYNQAASELKELRFKEDKLILRNAFIIAATTTGSSRYHEVLKEIGPRIVIVEEAAEVFEAHIVSSLSPSCEHLILIGDHVQLRPNPAVYKLAQQYSLDVSLFERLINNNTKRVMLSCQHRMRPDISVLMKHFYDKPIRNHASVHLFNNIVGFERNIFFLNHDKLEKNVRSTQSKFNKFESDYLGQLCLYITRQNYEQTRITVITMYSEQMSMIRRTLKQIGLSQVTVSTVDNYQGEENDFVLLSLVRSNDKKQIGFLKTDNRVCVALSRARKFLFCIGNFDMIAAESETWANIVNTAKQLKFFANSIVLTCGKHKCNDIEASDPGHFELRPDGGCLLPCSHKLPCGHTCQLSCHTYDHEAYECQKLCAKPLKCGHNCIQQCGHEKKCSECSFMVDKVIEECKHSIKFRCDTVPLKPDCQTKVSIKSPCKHKATQLDVFCGMQVWELQTKCSEICGELLGCGHRCPSKCHACFGGYIHSKCHETECQLQEKCNEFIYVASSNSNYFRNKLCGALSCSHKKCHNVTIQAKNNLACEVKAFRTTHGTKLEYLEIIFVEIVIHELGAASIASNRLVFVQNNWILFCKLFQIKLVKKMKKFNSFQKDFIEFELGKLMELIVSPSAGRIIPNDNRRLNEIHADVERIESLINYFEYKNAIRQHMKENTAASELFVELETFLFKEIHRFLKVKNVIQSCFQRLQLLYKLDVARFKEVMIVTSIDQIEK